MLTDLELLKKQLFRLIKAIGSPRPVPVWITVSTVLPSCLPLRASSWQASHISYEGAFSWWRIRHELLARPSGNPTAREIREELDTS